MRKVNKKLMLNRDTIRNLNPSDLGNAAGGRPHTFPGLTIGCPPPTFLCSVVHQSLLHCSISGGATTFRNTCNRWSHTCFGC